MPNQIARNGAVIGTTLLFFAHVFLGEVEAGAPILEHLATVSKVQIVFSTGGLQYDPPPGVDLADLDRRVRASASSALERENLKAVESAPQKLVISIRYRRDHNLPESQHAFYLLIEFVEKAVLDRRWSGCSPPSRCKEEKAVWVTSWSESSLTLTPEHLASERILDGVDIGVTEFAQTIVEARSASR